MIKVLYKTYTDFTIVLCPLYCKPGFVRGGRNEKETSGGRRKKVGGRREKRGGKKEKRGGRREKGPPAPWLTKDYGFRWSNRCNWY